MGERKSVTLTDIADAAGVSIATVDRVLNNRAPVRERTRSRVMAARARLERGEATPPPAELAAPERPLRFDFILESGRSFVRTMDQAVKLIGEGFAERQVRFVSHPLPQIDTTELPSRLLAIAEESDGLALVCREHAAITAAVNRIVARNVPVVTLSTDLAETRRLAYVGMNQVSAGRTAGYLMGRFIGPRDGEVILVVSGSFRSQEEREMGFRRVLREEFPNLTVRETINSDDRSEKSFQRMKWMFEAGATPLGVYNVAGGNTGIANAISEFGLTGKVVFIGHELNANTHDLLTHKRLDAVIDHDTRAEVFMGANVLLSHYGREIVPPVVTPTAPVIVLRENVADVLADRDHRWRGWLERDGHRHDQTAPSLGGRASAARG